MPRTKDLVQTPSGLELARAVLEWFGDDPIPAVLDVDRRLRDMARAIVKADERQRKGGAR